MQFGSDTSITGDSVFKRTNNRKSTIRLKKPKQMGWAHKPVEYILQRDGLLQAFKQHGTYLQNLQKVVNDGLQDLIKLHLAVKVSGYESGILKLSVANAAIATQLRFLQNHLINTLAVSAMFRNLVKIVVRVDSSGYFNWSPAAVDYMQQKNANQVEILSETMSEDQRFLAALQRLSKHELAAAEDTRSKNE